MVAEREHHVWNILLHLLLAEDYLLDNHVKKKRKEDWGAKRGGRERKRDMSGKERQRFKRLKEKERKGGRYLKRRQGG